jgi:hypothetical protein
VSVRQTVFWLAVLIENIAHQIELTAFLLPLQGKKSGRHGMNALRALDPSMTVIAGQQRHGDDDHDRRRRRGDDHGDDGHGDG